jgi:hypothetical protein
LKQPPAPSTRLYVLLARRAPLGIVFRRGPSKQVLVLSWQTDKHEFRLGQWFKGRIYCYLPRHDGVSIVRVLHAAQY